MTRSIHRSRFTLLTLCLTALSTLLLPLRTLAAQQGVMRMRPSVELGIASGGNWLDGGEAPKVSAGVGVFAGAGITRGVTAHVSGGVNLRVLSSSLTLVENDEEWDGGRAWETSLLAQTTIHSRRQMALRASLELAGGFTLVSGPGDILPFRDASSVAPTAEAGVSFSRGGSTEGAAGREVAVFARYRMVRVPTSSGEVLVEAGNMSRLLVGVRVTR